MTKLQYTKKRDMEFISLTIAKAFAHNI